MPLFTVTTNTEITSDGCDSFLTAASQGVAELLGKPERYVMVRLNGGQAMRFAGSAEPLAYCELKSIGLPVERTTEFSQALCQLIERHLSIPADRVYIEFSNAERNMWGWNGGTF